MTTPKIFVHGVPDTPAIWRPLLDALDTVADPAFSLSLPGFETPPPKGFKGTKDAYANWLFEIVEDLYENNGPVDLVGHDWGALLVLRVASLKPQMIKSWVISNAVIDAAYQGHRVARIWNTPILGEVFMSLVSDKQIHKGFIDAGVPSDIAEHEAAAWRNKHMRQCILQLYRSANGLRFKGPWLEDLANLPRNGCIIWGQNDPYVDLSVAERFSKTYSIPLHVVNGTEHWVIAERPGEVAGILTRFWRT